eukprot:COSAG05_NODE_204_length_14187_cov_99.887422_6_plen_61_part_00
MATLEDRAVEPEPEPEPEPESEPESEPEKGPAHVAVFVGMDHHGLSLYQLDLLQLVVDWL